MIKGASFGTRGFLVFWYVQWIGMGALSSWGIGRLLPFDDAQWVLQTWTWLAVAWMLLVGNHMATGSWILRGLRDWP